MRVAVDPNVLISATQWDSSVSHKLLMLLIGQDIPIYATKEILEEFAEVLLRDFRYSEKEVESILDTVNAMVIIVQPTELLVVIKDDPDDDKVLSGAVAANADFLLSYDNHLLNLKEFRRIKIVKPDDFLKLLRRLMQ
ncbi:putative toxin-antitoxin system toxin component, PIN family [Candidatus Woesearchaeota archaeon]|nr:putative toxin-antitoxin system toxin component, PIN family [Candidatus Woesearchaeota archaeon]